MRLYIEQGRFGEFTAEIISAENKRKQEQEEKETEERLWAAYVHSYSDKTFTDWKAGVLKPGTSAGNTTGKRDEDMTNADIDSLLNRLFPPKKHGHNATK